MKQLQATLFLVFFLISIYSLADVAIIKVGGVTAFDEARNGFASMCFENRQEFNLQEDLSNQAEIAEQIKAGTYRLIVAIGSQAAVFARGNFPTSPLLYTLVVNPDKIGLRGENIAGVSLDVSIREQFAILKSISKKIKRVGIIYTKPANDGLINTARAVAEEQRLSLVLSPISSSQEIQRAMTDLIGRCDALWIPPDPSLYSDEVIKYIGATSLAKALPCVGPNERYVRSGAIFSLSTDPVEAGRVAGEVANKILQGTSPSKVTIQETQKPKIIINKRAAGLLGLTIPRNVEDAASKVYQ